RRALGAASILCKRLRVGGESPVARRLQVVDGCTNSLVPTCRQGRLCTSTRRRSMRKIVSLVLIGIVCLAPAVAAAQATGGGSTSGTGSSKGSASPGSSTGSSSGSSSSGSMSTPSTGSSSSGSSTSPSASPGGASGSSSSLSKIDNQADCVKA